MDGTYVAVATAYDEFTTGPYSLTISDASPGVPSQVLFSVLPPANVTVRTPFIPPVVVEVLDSDDNLVPTAAVDVTLQLVDNPGSLIFRASGRGAGATMELFDPVTLSLLPPVATGQPNFIVAMTYDARSDRVLAEDEFGDLFTIDPLTGIQTFIGPVQDPFGSTIFMKGLAFEGPGGRLVGADAASDVIFEVDPQTGDATEFGSVTAPSAIEGFTGLAVDPTDGKFYAVARFDFVNRQVRNLVTIDISTLQVTDIGQLAEDGVAGITFDGNGDLYAVTGDGAPNAEKLWFVDKSNPAVMNLLGTPGGGGLAEAIATVPGQLTGTTKLTTIAGVAFFTDLEINATGVGYTISVSSPGLIGVISTPVDVNP
jgi:hypothetical protein